jgi:hypothetical protein
MRYIIGSPRSIISLTWHCKRVAARINRPAEWLLIRQLLGSARLALPFLHFLAGAVSDLRSAILVRLTALRGLFLYASLL